MSRAKAPQTDAAQREPAAGEQNQWLQMYRQMLRIRLFEEQVNDLYLTARMPGLAHLYSGEEAVAVGVCEALRRDDYITSTHRGHGHCLAKGASIDRMFAELLGKEPGYCRGKGGSMHIADQDTGNLGANAIVAGSAGIATGAAMSSKMRDSDQVAVCFFGDGALGQGLLYEVMNMASLWKLPVVYVCENNLYTEYTHPAKPWPAICARAPRRLASRPSMWMARMYGRCMRRRNVWSSGRGVVRGLPSSSAIPTATTATMSATSSGPTTARKRKRRSGKPSATRSCCWNWLTEQAIADAATLDAIRAETQAEVEAGVQFGLNAPYPDVSEVDQHVYA